MLRWLIVPLLTALLAAPAAALTRAQVRAIQTGALAPDKLEHASLAFTAGLMLGVPSRRPAVCLGGALLLGLGKELWDRRRTHFDAGDLAADAVGATAATTVTAALGR